MADARRVLDANPALLAAFDWLALREQEIAREWILNLGTRPGLARVGHLLCELFYRLQMAGLTNGNSCHLPITQMHLAEAVGVSSVQMNRMLQTMRAEGLIVLKSSTLTLSDMARLSAISEFSPSYLRMRRSGAASGPLR